MIGWLPLRRLLVLGFSAALTATGCAFQGLNSLPLPGAVGRGPDATIYHVQIANVGALESNSPVMIDDVVVGSVGKMTVQGWHANVEVSVRPGVVIPANAVASVGQTSLLGSMHLELNPPLGQKPVGRLEPGATIPLNKSSTYPSTEQTLSTLSVVVNSGGLGQIGDIVHNFSAALFGREPQVRDLINRLDTFVGTLNDQRDNIIATIDELNRFSGTLAGQDEVIARTLRKIPQALDVLLRERARFTEALVKLGNFSDTASQLVNDTRAELVTNLQNLEPTICALADIGPDIDTALAYALLFPLGQNLIDRGIRGDYMNLFVTVDLTRNRIKRGLAAGTPWFQGDAELVPAPGDAGYDAFYAKYTNDPLNFGITPTPPWLASLPESSPPPAQTGVSYLGVQPPILRVPKNPTPSGCGR
jgi:phospholipid/cholesterol/gamma-HCH transport system substrate-binding protein